MPERKGKNDTKQNTGAKGDLTIKRARACMHAHACFPTRFQHGDPVATSRYHHTSVWLRICANGGARNHDGWVVKSGRPNGSTTKPHCDGPIWTALPYPVRRSTIWDQTRAETSIFGVPL